ncbi:hypothetical protein RM844_14195 [Streptomyces sp. DSM 44915]|uniref:Uncharacterized protein n=1 Tax=Streptomyces chisholmiae TaxID=3075540 RepID=A0ABU2JR33_9ACTN|nr:hypothetical protein [Streptomyces sp. DSM 44915]MDT0267438.1 hypothetical protein [Streptomyces sp. DSM 44915]
MSRWDVYGDPNLEEQLVKHHGSPPWDALRVLVRRLEWQADEAGHPLSYPWSDSLRRAVIEDETEVYGVVEYMIESRRHQIARILTVDWLPDITT